MWGIFILHVIDSSHLCYYFLKKYWLELSQLKLLVGLKLCTTSTLTEYSCHILSHSYQWHVVPQVQLKGHDNYHLLWGRKGVVIFIFGSQMFGWRNMYEAWRNIQFLFFSSATVKSHFKALGLYNFKRSFGWAYKRLYPGGLISGIKETFRNDEIKRIWETN